MGIDLNDAPASLHEPSMRVGQRERRPDRPASAL
jgi:hypothetical protein